MLSVFFLKEEKNFSKLIKKKILELVTGVGKTWSLPVLENGDGEDVILNGIEQYIREIIWI